MNSHYILESHTTAFIRKNKKKREIYLSSPKGELLSSYGEQFYQEASWRGILRYSIHLKMEESQFPKHSDFTESDNAQSSI
jgi:hypothetical protein